MFLVGPNGRRQHRGEEVILCLVEIFPETTSNENVYPEEGRGVIMPTPRVPAALYTFAELGKVPVPPRWLFHGGFVGPLTNLYCLR